MSEAVLANLLATKLSAADHVSLLRDLSKTLYNKELSPQARSSLARLLATAAALEGSHLDSLTLEQWPTDAFTSLVAYTLHIIRDAGHDILKLHEPVLACCQNDSLLSVLVSLCALSLAKTINDELLRQERHPAADGSRYRVLADEVSKQECGENTVMSRVLATYCDLAPLLALEWLSFVRALALNGGSLSASFFQIIEILQVLLQSSSDDLFRASRDTLTVLLAPAPNVILAKSLHGRKGVPKSTRQRLWETIEHLTSSAQVERKTAGYTLWSRLLTRPALSPPESAVHSEQYWLILWVALAQGSSEHRKYALSIIRGTVTSLKKNVDVPSMTFRIDYADEAQTQYAKFAAVFETIVLSRYLNQVQSSLPDLSIISQPDSTISKSWIIALLHAALSHGMQDSIRKVVGEWTLTHGRSILVASSQSVPAFLERAFLSWATLGYHYTGSLHRDKDGQRVCKHGESIRQFLLQVIEDSQDPSSVITSILAYLSSQGGRMFAFGRAFALDAVAQASRSGTCVLNHEGQQLLLDVASRQGFQSMVQDLMTIRCSEIAQPGLGFQVDHYRSLQQAAASVAEPPPSLGSLTLGELLDQMLGNVKVQLPANDVVFAAGQVERISHFAELLRQTRCQCLWNTGLEAASEYFERTLDSSGQASISEADLVTITEALWDECEAQDHPRKVIRRLPKIVLHCVIVSRCELCLDLQQLVSRLTIELQQLADNRIYVFTPFAEALRTACLHTPQAATALPLRQLITHYANNPPVTKVEFELEKAMEPELVARVPFRTYEYYYGKDASYGYACIFDMLNRLPQIQDWSLECKAIFEDLLQLWIDQRQPVPVFSRWKTTSQLQVMLLCVERILPLSTSEEIGEYLHKLFAVLALEPLPRLRYLLEWIILRFYAKFSERRDDLLLKQWRLDLDNPKYLVSVMKINSALARLPDSTEDFALELMTQLISLSASPKIVVRHEAQWIFTPLWQCAKQRGWKSLTANIAFERVDETIRRLPTYKTPPLARLLERFDPIDDHNMTHLLSGDYLRIEPAEATRLQHQDLLDVASNEGQTSEGDGIMLMSIGPPPNSTANEPGSIDEAEQAQIEIQSERSISAPLQIKSSAWQDDLVTGITTATGYKRRRSRHVVIVASFIDNAFNIGGLSRLGEIFGVESLQIQNLKVLKNKDFTSVSVASHMWLDIEQLEETNVPQFLLKKKLDGYKVIGIEQTDSSKILGTDECQLPEKIVLVLGSEREGIPARILADLDSCVEIRQMGVTRSMNVQTAAAVVLYEYSRQHPS